MNNELDQEASRPIAADDREAVGLRPIIAGYLRQRTVILVSAIISLVAAIIYLLVYPKTYEIMARIQIQDDASMMASGGIGLGDAAGVMKTFGLGGLSSGSGVSIDDEISTLRSNSLMRKMVTRLGLYAEYRRPLSFIKLYGEEPVHVICDSTTLDALDDKVEFRLTATDRDEVTIKAKADGKKETFHFDGFPAEVRLHGKTFRFERVKQRAGASNGGVKLDITVYPPRWVAEKAADDFLIEDYSKSANIIELSCTDYERRRAKDMLNVLIDYYNQEAYDYKKSQSDVSLVFLNERIAHVMDELEKVERNIERYKAANKITDVEYDIQYYAEYMRDLKGRMIEAETQANMIALMDAFVKNPANRYKLVPSLLTSGAAETEGSAIFLYNQALLEREKAIRNSNEQNPMVASLTTQVDRLRETVFQSINNAQQSMQLTRRSLEKQERELLDRMGSIPVQERVYVDYKRQQEILQGVYLILLQKREEIGLALGQKTDRAKIVDTAFVKAKPVAPRKVFALAGFFVLTLVLSIGWIVCRDQYRLLRKEMKRTDTAAD
ncbi:hypothetical protein BHU16_05665 [Tannerella sp. oral taxon 808]|nr:hypothetical protein BHU16_05665 [Tannerella sp. oral taxon 808]